jgi:hypothetical protein
LRFIKKNLYTEQNLKKLVEIIAKAKTYSKRWERIGNEILELDISHITNKFSDLSYDDLENIDKMEKEILIYSLNIKSHSKCVVLDAEKLKELNEKEDVIIDGIRILKLNDVCKNS